MTFRSKFFVIPLSVIAFCACPYVAQAQFGWNAGQVQSQFGKAVRIYFDTGHPTDAAYRVDGNETTPTTTYYLSENRVAGVMLQWKQPLTEPEAMLQISKLTGLPQAMAAVKLNKAIKPPTSWRVNQHQSAVLPPLGAWTLMAVQVPQGQAPVGLRFRWTEYYDKWGNRIGTSPTRTETIFANINRFAGMFRFDALKVVTPLIRQDDAAYAWIEYSNNTNDRRFLTNQIEVMEPALYWCMRFAQFRAEEKRLAGMSGENQFRPTMNDLRPYHLEVGDDYERALFDHLTPNETRSLLKIWRTNAAVGAVDNEQIPLQTLGEFTSVCDPDELANELLRGIRPLDPKIAVRRAEILDQLGRIRWVAELAEMLEDKKRGPVVLPDLQRMARRHAKSDEEILKLGDKHNLWDRWYNQIK